MTLIISLGVAVSILMAILSYSSKLHFILKFVSFSAMISLGLFTYFHYVSNLGKPVQDYPPSEFVYVHHEISGDDLILWVVTKETGSRLYQFPYDRETAKSLEEAKNRRGQGSEQVGKVDILPSGQRVIHTEDFAPSQNTTKPEGG